MLVDMIESGTTANSATLPADNGEFQQARGLKPCTAGIRIDSDGDVYSKSNDGSSWQRVGTWLLVGPNTNFWVSRTIDSGSLAVDAGAGPLACTADRDYSIANAALGTTKTTLLTIELSNDASGSPIIASVQYEIEADLS
jgi:hypothetical protein